MFPLLKMPFISFHPSWYLLIHLHFKKSFKCFFPWRDLLMITTPFSVVSCHNIYRQYYSIKYCDYSITYLRRCIPKFVTIHSSPAGFILQGLGVTMGTVCIKCYTHNVILSKCHISQFLPTIKQTPNIIPVSPYSANLYNSHLSANILTESKWW